MFTSRTILLSSLLFLTKVNCQSSGSGFTTRYWDCCMASCAWTKNTIGLLASNSGPVKSCDVKNQPLNDPSATSSCTGGAAYMCTDQSPWAVSESLSYGFAASIIPGACCACYELTFTSEPVGAAGKKMIVQSTNTGDIASGQFDLQVSSIPWLGTLPLTFPDSRWRRWREQRLYHPMERTTSRLGESVWWYRRPK